jgi:hypothetical protein
LIPCLLWFTGKFYLFLHLTFSEPCNARTDCSPERRFSKNHTNLFLLRSQQDTKSFESWDIQAVTTSNDPKVASLEILKSENIHATIKFCPFSFLEII